MSVDVNVGADLQFKIKMLTTRVLQLERKVSALLLQAEGMADELRRLTGLRDRGSDQI